MARARIPNDVSRPAGDTATTHDVAAPRSARAARARRSRPTAPDADAWITSRDGLVAHERAVEDLELGRVQHLDHAQFLEAFDVAWLPANVRWTVTDEFTRRHGRLRGRSHRAVGSALTAFIERLAATAAGSAPTSRAGLQLRPMPRDCPPRTAWALSWSNAGRATYLVEWVPSGAGLVAHVTWLAIGPHGAPDRASWRGNA